MHDIPLFFFSSSLPIRDKQTAVHAREERERTEIQDYVVVFLFFPL